MSGYDVIGDVHGHIERLEKLLRRLGYREVNGAWRHVSRTAVFVGDLIDRGRGRQRATVELVRRMVDAGSALIVLGNHEFNAVAYATVDPETGDFHRPHSAKNMKQHREFIEEAGFDTPLHRSMIDWFRTIPLWLDLDGLRVVHACWSKSDIEHLGEVLDADRTLNDRVVAFGTTKRSDTYVAIENVLKGPEVDMGGCWYFDKDDNKRTKARAAWWRGDARTLRDAAVVPDGTQLYDADDRPIDRLPEMDLPATMPRYIDDVPVIFGHYWRTGLPTLEGTRVACVDYSAGKGDPLVAYQWSGEPKLEAANFVAA